MAWKEYVFLVVGVLVSAMLIGVWLGLTVRIYHWIVP